MKNIRKHLAVAAASVLACGAAAAHPDDTQCSADTLAGTYVFSASGWSAATGVWLPKAIVEVIRFNGDGTLTVLSATVANPAGNGAVVQSPPGATGIYTLDAGCTGTLTFTPGPSFSLAAAPRGNEVWMIQANPNNVFQGSARRVAN